MNKKECSLSSVVGQQLVDKCCDISNAYLVITVDISTNGADDTFITTQQIVNQVGHVLDADFVIMVNIAYLMTMRKRTIVLQGNFLDITPSALGTIVVEGFHLVEESALGGQV